MKKHPQTTPPKQLCISGGGIRGFAFVGALLELYDTAKARFTTISGCSVGAFIGACLVIGYHPRELLDVLFEIDLNHLKDIDLQHFSSHKSILRGENVAELFRGVFRRKVNPEITLGELHARTGVTFIVAVTCMNTQDIEYISYKTDPGLPLLKLICMTTAIPGILPAVSHKGKLYVDGAIIDNLPLSPLNIHEPMAVILCAHKPSEFIENHCFNVYTFFRVVLKLIYRNNNHIIVENVRNPAMMVIEVDPCDISVTGFHISLDDKFRLIRAGRFAAQKGISSYSSINTDVGGASVATTMSDDGATVMSSVVS